MAMFQGPGQYEELRSERVVVASPLSFAGSTQRLANMTTDWNDALRVVFLLLVLPFVWVFIAAWYMVWGLWLVPYRLLRRGSRKRKRQGLQHREMLNQMQYQAMTTHAAIAQQTAVQTTLAAQQLAAHQHALSQSLVSSQQPSASTDPFAPPATEQQPAIGAALPERAAAWYPDPLGKQRLRYWDGTGWTEHLAD